jgi:hypothetical protein
MFVNTWHSSPVINTPCYFINAVPRIRRVFAAKSRPPLGALISNDLQNEDFLKFADFDRHKGAQKHKKQGKNRR